MCTQSAGNTGSKVMARKDLASCCYKKVKYIISEAFRQYGEFVGQHPWRVIWVNIVVFGGLGLGLLRMKIENDMEKVYFPKNSRATKDRQFIRDTFPDVNAFAYNAFSQSDPDKSATLLFTCKSQSMFDSRVVNEIDRIVGEVKSLTSVMTGKNYSQLCARLSSKCVVEGEFVLKSEFQQAVSFGLVTYPFWNSTVLSTSLAGVNVSARGVLLSATVLRVSFKLTVLDKGWLEAFLSFCHGLKPNYTEVAYSTPDSLEEELDKSTKGDIVYFSLTITLVCVYASVVSSGGNPVSTRGALAFGGILAAGLGILGSMGLLCLCGVEFVNIVGVVPFLIIGIGVDDMFLLMSSWSEHLPSDKTEMTVGNVPRLLGKTLATAGVGITITSLTDFLAFVIGSTSIFLSVTNFSLYAGVAVLFCYIANASLFSACMALHGQRVYSNIHNFTCQTTKTRDELLSKGRCYAFICGGQPPAGSRDDESICEKIPGKILPHLFQYIVVNIIIIFSFMGYLGIAIYGATQMKQGLALQDLVLETSYYRKYLKLSDNYFPASIPVAFIITQKQNYTGTASILLQDLLMNAQKDELIDPHYKKCWLDSYQNSSDFDPSAPHNFVTNLLHFLDNHIQYISDVVLDVSNTSIMASRCFVLSKPNNDPYANAAMMKQMRSLADSQLPVPVIAYHSSFVAFEQFLQVLPATLQLVGIAVAVMTVVTFLLLPHPLMVLLVVVTIVMILVGIFGFMHFWGLTLSSITMIHLVMSVGFSVDFSAHVCAAYLMSSREKSKARAADAIRHAAAPIFNGATSTMLGGILLVASDSFIFQSFFKVMVLVIGFGLLHAVFFLPAVLSLIGPSNQVDIISNADIEKCKESGKSRGDVVDEEPNTNNTENNSMDTSVAIIKSDQEQKHANSQNGDCQKTYL